MHLSESTISREKDIFSHSTGKFWLIIRVLLLTSALPSQSFILERRRWSGRIDAPKTVATSWRMACTGRKVPIVHVSVGIQAIGFCAGCGCISIGGTWVKQQQLQP